MGNCLSSTRTTHVKPKREPMAEKGRRRVKLEDLPEDVLNGILSKLPMEEVVRTSVLSSQWRRSWIGCPKLNFNSRARCSRYGVVRQNTQKFADHVNAVLRLHSGMGVEEIQVKCTLESKLVDHLDNWIRFAIISRTKNLALDLSPWYYRDDPYIFPFALFVKEGASCLRCLRVKFVCIEPPSQFLGFSNLRVLELSMVKTTREDLEDLLCSCCNLEWLNMVECYLQDKLIVVRPLPRLQYLRIANCEDITKIELHAAELSIFVYAGQCIPIALHHASKLESAQFTLRFGLVRGRPRSMLGSTHMFSRLTHLQLLVHLITQDDYNDKMLFLLSFLRVTPVIEKLEVHLEDFFVCWYRENGPFRHKVPRCEYKHLKSMHVSGFLAASFQVEFIMHVVENAPVIEAVTIESDHRYGGGNSNLPEQKLRRARKRAALYTVKGSLLERLPPDAKVILI